MWLCCWYCWNRWPSLRYNMCTTCRNRKKNSEQLFLSRFEHRHLFHSKIYAPSSSLLQGKHLPFTPSPLRLNIFRLFVILSLTQLYRYTPEIFLFSTATFKYKYRVPLRRIGQEYSAKIAFSIFQLEVKGGKYNLTNYYQILITDTQLLFNSFQIKYD
jgi:hypothetical protein